jgi:hypothetical protein
MVRRPTEGPNLLPSDRVAQEHGGTASGRGVVRPLGGAAVGGARTRAGECVGKQEIVVGVVRDRERHRLVRVLRPPQLAVIQSDRQQVVVVVGVRDAQHTRDGGGKLDTPRHRPEHECGHEVAPELPRPNQHIRVIFACGERGKLVEQVLECSEKSLEVAGVQLHEGAKRRARRRGARHAVARGRARWERT